MKRGRIAAAYRAQEAETDKRLAGKESAGFRRGGILPPEEDFAVAEKRGLSSEIGELERLLKDVPVSHVIERLSLEYRLGAARKAKSELNAG